MFMSMQPVKLQIRLQITIMVSSSIRASFQGLCYLYTWYYEEIKCVLGLGLGLGAEARNTGRLY